MSNLFLSKLQRGPTLKMMVSILRIDSDNAETETEIVNVDDKVELMLKFKCGKGNDLIPSIRMRKNASSDSAIVIKILSRNVNKQIFCSEEWVEVEMEPKRCDQSVRKYVRLGNQAYEPLQMAYYIEVNITVHVPGSIMLLPSSNLYKDTEFTDFTLLGTDGKVAVHKTTLMAQSDVFMAIMRGEWKEKAEGHMKVEGVTVETLQHLKEYMYLGMLPDEGLDLLLVVAARYLMDTLMTLCITKLVESMKPEDFDGLVKLACQHNIPGLVRALVLQIPDDVVNSIHLLKINDQQSKDNDEQ